MKRRVTWIVVGVLSWGFLAGYDQSQVAQAGLGALLRKEIAATTQPSPTTAPTAAQGKSAAESLLGGALAAATRPAAMPTTNPSAGSLTAQAAAKLDQAIAYIKENKLDLADKMLTQLEQQKALLPASLQGRLADVRTMLESAKGVPGGLSLPKS